MSDIDILRIQLNDINNSTLKILKDLNDRVNHLENIIQENSTDIIEKDFDDDDIEFLNGIVGENYRGVE